MQTLEANYLTCIQGSAEWFSARLGCVTSSRIADCIAKRKRVKAGEKAEEMACRRDMRLELAGEIVTGKADEHYISKYMEDGREREPLARNEYELTRACFVDQVGFVYHPTIKMAGASPDGLVGEDGLIEIKAPKRSTHIGYIYEGVVPEQYIPQMLWQMACTGRQWCDFVSYHPDFPALFIKRLDRTKEVDAVIRGMELEVQQFLTEVDETVEKLKASRGN